MIFVVNDPMLVQSDHLPAKSKRKPDIIKVSLKTFKRWLRLPDNTDFNTCQVLAANREIKIFGKPCWIDVGQFWELKLGRSLSDLVTNGKEKTTFRGEDFSTSKSVPGMFYPNCEHLVERKKLTRLPCPETPWGLNVRHSNGREPMTRKMLERDPRSSLRLLVAR